jgi:hypothetical protein
MFKFYLIYSRAHYSAQVEGRNMADGIFQSWDIQE